MENLIPSDWGEMDEVFGPTRFWHLQVGERIAANAAWSYTDPPAEYWSLKLGDKVHEDILWSYPDPIPEAPKIKGLISFYNEMVDITLDGELQPRPVTPWS